MTNISADQTSAAVSSMALTGQTTDPLYLYVSGVTGPSTATGYVGAFSPDGYAFDVNQGTASVLTLDLNDPSSAKGITGLYKDALLGAPGQTATLYVATTGSGPATVDEKIVLSGVSEQSEADLGNDVTVALDFATATITTYDRSGSALTPVVSTVQGPESVAAADVAPLPVPRAAPTYLVVDDVAGGVTAAGHIGDFELESYSLGTSSGIVEQQDHELAGTPKLDPLIVTLPESGTKGENQLLADMLAGSILSGVTLFQPTATRTAQYEVILQDATIVQDQVAAGGDAFAFDYEALEIIDNATTPQASFAFDVGRAGATFASVPTVALRDTPAENADLFFQVANITGPSTTAGYAGAFRPNGYTFDVNNGTASVLTLDLNDPASAQGIIALYADALTDGPKQAATLYVVTGGPEGPDSQVDEEIVLSGASEQSEADVGNDVTIALDFSTATITTNTYDHNGVALTPVVTTVQGPASVAAAETAPVPVPTASPTYLNVSGADGGVTATGYTGDFELASYSLGTSSKIVEQQNHEVFGTPTLDPLVVTLPQSGTNGENQLLADMLAGSILSRVTLFQTNNNKSLQYEVILQDATIVQDQVAGGGDAFAFDYRGLKVTDHAATTPSSFTFDAGSAEATFASVPTVALADATADGKDLYFEISGITGPSTTAGYVGAIYARGYTFGVNNGTASVLTLDLNAHGGTKGMIDLYKDALLGAPPQTGTLFVVAFGPGGPDTQVDEKIVLSGLIVQSETDLGNDVTIALDYTSAAITTDTYYADGKALTKVVTTVQGPAGAAAADTAPVPLPLSTASPAYLKVSGIDGGVTATGYANDFELASYSLGTSSKISGQQGRELAATPKVDPLIVTLPKSGTNGENQLLADMLAGSILSSVTLFQTTATHALQYEVILQDATIVRDQVAGGGEAFAFDYRTLNVAEYSTTEPKSFTFDAADAGATFATVPDLPLNETIDMAACFCPGTLIRTPRGEVAVEKLAAGDQVVTLSGQTRPIVWIGRGQVEVTRGRRGAATPVLVRKGALADNVPHHDLRITKGHSLWVDGALIPVEFLVNHRTILWDDHAQTVVFYHIELPAHDVLLANGVPSESYRDDGNRWLFENRNRRWGAPAQAPCAPVLTGGAAVDALWRRLLDRAGLVTHRPLPQDMDLHLSVDGKRLDSISRPDGNWMFRLRSVPASVRIVSDSAVPAELGLHRDARQLGVALRRIVLRQAAATRRLEMDDPRLSKGFHPFEPENAYRWTDGDALIPRALFAGVSGSSILELAVADTIARPMMAAA